MNANTSTPTHDLTGFQRDLLGTVARLDAPNGLDVKAKLEEFYDGEVRHGRLYPNLDTLVSKGLVDKGQKDRRTNEYELTLRGQRALTSHARWFSEAADGGDRDE